MYEMWKSEVEFVTVYVKEAHPIDDRPPTPTNAKANIVIKQPVTLDERRAVAERCTAVLHLRTPMVVDEIDNRVAQAYWALPDRLYVVDREGQVAYRGGPGPFAFNPDEMEQSLLLLLLAQDEKKSTALP
jgi:type I thyroxine 5'-deiodinase